ncbi:MAG: hypothetical protein UU48_C0004G0034 [Candidatus Uhrbacteria bacterium GW2011_GWF2_41_16]|uniref:Uncharacterized protein n=2 Tax=Candidatus Uhriibacteriota TaxID=1752732 RepID=A0A0G0VF08_9BACT|nr:MAG: hypothetical protein UU35_C0013G0006 [Candidatus Uhrbacteria bacterium GW2011_GWC2_41_11]KKR98241.1 MAG: hypothetical protein UU48_C0004G0034 [Candidatus Uhrbacteria bacterium GW2011_GWF2_41_16]
MKISDFVSTVLVAVPAAVHVTRMNSIFGDWLVLNGPQWKTECVGLEQVGENIYLAYCSEQSADDVLWKACLAAGGKTGRYLDTETKFGPTGFVRTSGEISIRRMIKAFLDLVRDATNQDILEVKPVTLKKGIDLSDMDKLERRIKQAMGNIKGRGPTALRSFPFAWVVRDVDGGVILRWEGQWTRGRYVEVTIYPDHAIFEWNSATGRTSQFIDVAGRLQGVVIDEMETSEEITKSEPTDETTQDIEVDVFQQSFDVDCGEDAEA